MIRVKARQELQLTRQRGASRATPLLTSLINHLNSTTMNQAEHGIANDERAVQELPHGLPVWNPTLAIRQVSDSLRSVFDAVEVGLNGVGNVLCAGRNGVSSLDHGVLQRLTVL